jgi:hypothetical protein
VEQLVDQFHPNIPHPLDPYLPVEPLLLEIPAEVELEEPKVLEALVQQDHQVQDLAQRLLLLLE